MLEPGLVALCSARGVVEPLLPFLTGVFGTKGVEGEHKKTLKSDKKDKDVLAWQSDGIRNFGRPQDPKYPPNSKHNSKHEEYDGLLEVFLCFAFSFFALSMTKHGEQDDGKHHYVEGVDDCKGGYDTDVQRPLRWKTPE